MNARSPKPAPRVFFDEATFFYGRILDGFKFASSCEKKNLFENKSRPRRGAKKRLRKIKRTAFRCETRGNYKKETDGRKTGPLELLEV